MPCIERKENPHGFTVLTLPDMKCCVAILFQIASIYSARNKEYT